MEVPIGKKAHTLHTHKQVAVCIGCGILAVVVVAIGVCCFTLAHRTPKEAPHGKSEVYILKDEVVDKEFIR